MPPILTIRLRLTTIRSIDRIIIRSPVTRSEIPLVDVNGETKATDEPESVMGCCGVGVGEGVTTGVGDGLGVETT